MRWVYFTSIVRFVLQQPHAQWIRWKHGYPGRICTAMWGIRIIRLGGYNFGSITYQGVTHIIPKRETLLAAVDDVEFYTTSNSRSLDEPRSPFPRPILLPNIWSWAKYHYRTLQTQRMSSVRVPLSGWIDRNRGEHETATFILISIVDVCARDWSDVFAELEIVPINLLSTEDLGWCRELYTTWFEWS